MPLSDKLYAAILEACLSYEGKLTTRNRAAIAGIGQRVRLLCELMYNTGFSITDAVTTGRSRLKMTGNDYYFDVQRRKLEGSPASKHIWMKVDREFAKRLLAMRPSPDTDPKYFFWSGSGEVDNAADSWWKVFPRIRALVDAKLMREEMGVDDEGETIQPTFHCFRYSFAQNLFAAGADVPDVAKYLGDTPAIVAKHYWKFSKKLQQKGERLLNKVISKRKKR
jgi:integrase/recombinase XerD